MGRGGGYGVGEGRGVMVWGGEEYSSPTPGIPALVVAGQQIFIW